MSTFFKPRARFRRMNRDSDEPGELGPRSEAFREKGKDPYPLG